MKNKLRTAIPQAILGRGPQTPVAPRSFWRRTANLGCAAPSFPAVCQAWMSSRRSSSFTTKPGRRAGVVPAARRRLDVGRHVCPRFAETGCRRPRTDGLAPTYAVVCGSLPSATKNCAAVPRLADTGRTPARRSQAWMSRNKT